MSCELIELGRILVSFKIPCAIITFEEKARKKVGSVVK